MSELDTIYLYSIFMLSTPVRLGTRDVDMVVDYVIEK